MNGSSIGKPNDANCLSLAVATEIKIVSAQRLTVKRLAAVEMSIALKVASYKIVAQLISAYCPKRKEDVT